MIRKATLKPVEAKEVIYVRYTGDNFEELEKFVNEVKRFPKEKYYFYLSTSGDKEIYWKEHGFIKKGDFVVLCDRGYLTETKWDDFAIVSWKDFPRMVSEDMEHGRNRNRFVHIFYDSCICYGVYNRCSATTKKRWNRGY